MEKENLDSQIINIETRIYIHPYQCKHYNIYPEYAMPMNESQKVGRIELCEVIQLGDDMVMIPLQVYTTSDPLLYKLVVLIDCLKMEDFYTPIVCISESNIRSLLMTKDGKVFMPHYERIVKEDLKWDDNIKVEYDLIDITPKNNLVLSCDISNKIGHYYNINMSQKDRLNHFIEAGRIRYIVERFGFNEKEIILLPNSSDDHERIIRFKVMGNIFCIKNGALFLEKQG